MAFRIRGVIYCSTALMLRGPACAAAAEAAAAAAAPAAAAAAAAVGSVRAAEEALAAATPTREEGPTWLDVMHPREGGPGEGAEAAGGGGVVRAPTLGGSRAAATSVAGAPEALPPDEGAAVRHKYAARLQAMKMNAAAARAGAAGTGSAQSGAAAAARGDPAHWNASPGAKVALLHLRERRLRQAMLAFGEAEAHFPTRTLLPQIGSFAFHPLLRAAQRGNGEGEGGEGKVDGELGAGVGRLQAAEPHEAAQDILRVCASWGVKPSTTLVVGRDTAAPGLLHAAREAGCLVVRVGGPAKRDTDGASKGKLGWLFGASSAPPPVLLPDFVVERAADVTTVVEQFNGVSLRASAMIDDSGQMAPEHVAGVGRYGVAAT